MIEPCDQAIECAVMEKVFFDESGTQVKIYATMIIQFSFLLPANLDYKMKMNFGQSSNIFKPLK